ncbi:dihydrofolate reductase family protein [Nocardioides limicola]|uniref:dihydrofolate reductase family protein n=1 Tax=Nocardioides limicola TaxID=2803368 RepID=UPI00193BC735|nr:dihydrofolate reductase family protein [Nocardioides sp. DJM-14]
MTVLRQWADLGEEELADAYAPGGDPWLRLNFVATVDGAVQGPDGLSRSINNEVDHRVFGLLRELADVVVVGAGTIRDEEYRPNPKPLVVVSRSGRVPDSLRAGDLGQVVVATGADAPFLAETRELLGADRTWLLGDAAPDLTALRRALVDRGLTQILCEGGPSLARDLLAAGLVDELCLTTVARLLAGDHLRLADGAPVDVPLTLRQLVVADDGTLLARWFTR